MTALILSLLLTITPKECNARPEWCVCRQYVEQQANRCLVDSDVLSIGDKRELDRAGAACEDERQAGIQACEVDDGDAYDYGENVGADT